MRSTWPPVVRRAVVESTQVEAFALASQGAVDRTVVLADHQTAGRGRRGRLWLDAPGTSLLVSVLVRPRMPTRLLPTIALTSAVAVAEALQGLTGLTARLKWPNDVRVRDRKLAGILVESRLAVTPLVVVGIGINLNQSEFPPPLEDHATSVRLEIGRPVERDAVLTALLESFDGWRHRLERLGFGPVRERWLDLAETVGRRVTTDHVSGRAVDLDTDGALLVDDGARVHRVTAGEIVESGVDHAARR